MVKDLCRHAGKLFQVLITRYAVVWTAMKFFVLTFLVTVALMMTATFVQEVSAETRPKPGQ